MTYAEWVEQKKREKAKKSSSYSEWVETTRDVNLDDIAPVKTTTSEEEDSKWYDGYFQKSSVFDDGYQFGDITKARDAFHQDVAENLLTGVVGMGEKIVDFGAWLLPAMAGGIGSQSGQGFDFDLYNEVKEDITPFMEKDLYDEKKVSQTILLHDQWERHNGMELDEASVLDYKTDSLVQSLGQLAATAPTGNLWWLVTGATAFGGQAEEALKEGATFEEAGASAAIAAGAEVLTERIGGIKFGKNGLTFADEVIKPLTNKISNKVVKALVDMGIDAASEGFEELITEVCNNLGSSLYKEEDAWTLLTNEEAVNGYIDSFVGGAALGGMFGVGNLANNTVKLTESEQKVVDKVTEDRIAEKAKEGKVSEALKIKIREEVTEDMDHGRIPMDTIEEVLGGDTYKSYKDTIDSEEALKKELEDLNGMKTGDLTGIQSDRLAELKGMNLSDTSKRDGLKAQLRSEVYGLTKGSRLGNSYTENYRRTQSFTADLNQYKGKGQEFVKSVIESGKLNDATATHNYIDFLAKSAERLNITIKLTDVKEMMENGQLVSQQLTLTADGKTTSFSIAKNAVPGAEFTVKIGDTVVDSKNYEVDYQKGTITFKDAPQGEVTIEYQAAPNGWNTNKGEIVLNSDTKNYLIIVAGHEITHSLENTKHYAKLQKALFEYAKAKGEYDTRRAYTDSVYTKQYAHDENYDKNIDKELTADLVGDYIFSDTEFVQSLYKQDQNIFKQVWDSIKHLVKMATAGSTEARELEKAQMRFEQVWREGAKDAKNGVKAQASDAKLSLSDIEKMSERDYNHHGWAKVNDLLDDREFADFMSKTGDKARSGQNWYRRLSDNRHMFEVGHDGVNNTIVISDGNFHKPSIDRVYHISLNNETDIEKVRDGIYHGEKNGKWASSSDFISESYGDGLVRLYTADDFFDFQTLWEEYRSTGSERKRTSRKNGRLSDRGRNNSRTGDHPVKTSSTDGVFFDGKKYSLSDSTVRPTNGMDITGEDVRYTPDIAPVMEAPVSKTETTVAENATVAPVMGEEPVKDKPLPEDAPKFEQTNKTVPPNDGGVTDNSSLATSTSTVSNNTISKNAPSVNPTETTSDKETPSGEMRSWAETSTESEAVGRAILPDDLDAEKIYYQPISNKKTLGNANARLDSLGYEDAVTYFNGQFANKNISLDDVALGERLIQEAVKKGDYKTAGELITDISILGTELGQKVQALSIIKRLTPEGQLRAIQRTIERGKTKGDKVFEGVEVTQEMTDQILKTYKEDGTYDQNELNAAVENVKQQIADQMEVTRLEKVNAWRYLSMLGNPKTHIRNLVSNIAMKGTVAVKNAIARTVEDIAPIKNRTKTWKRSTETVKEFSRQKAVELKEVISGGGKYGESAEIKAKREIFKNKILKGVYGFNSEMLSKEDWWFSRPAFTNALSECLTANGIRTQEDIDGNPEMVEKAIKYALEQAQIATFQQTSWLANKIGEMERKNTLTNIAVGSILPFKKTPINIAKTGLNYSLLGFAKTAYDYVVQKKNGEVNASELIDSLAQNTTGTALMMIGYMLAKAGFLNGAGEDDKEGKYDYQLGEQAYSINFGGSTYSLSWLSPVAMPLFVGVNMYEQFVEKNEWNGNVVIETMAKTLDPLSEMSFLSSLDSTLSSYDSGIMKFAGIFETAAQSYIGQFAPTLTSQIATVIDDTKRTTKVSGNSGNTFAEETINKLIYKIPFLRETLEPSIDIWGNEIKQTENVMERAFETFLAPYAKRDDISSDVDAEIKDLYAQTGDNGLIPSAPYNYINYSGEKYNMSAKEYTDFKKEYGQTAFELLDELFNTTSYRNADSETKADMVNKVYDYARDEAKRDFFSDRGIKYDYEEDLIKGAIENDMVPDEYAFSIKYPKKYDFFKNNGISYNDYADADEDGKRAYTWAYENPGKYTMSKAFSDDFLTYYGYRKELNAIEGDKDANGETVSGSKKTKVINYINNMDLDYGQKIILFRSMYSGKEDRANYNADIVEYLNSRDDISYEEMVTILEELDMKVSSDGSITWD